MAAHASKIDSLNAALKIVDEMGDQALAMTLRRAIHGEERRARGSLQTDPAVAQALRRNRDAEDQRVLAQQLELKEKVSREREVKALKREAQELQEKAAKARKLLREAQELSETQDALKSFSPEMLGDGRARGGGAQFRTRRNDVLDRILRHGGAFTAQQRNDWSWFKETWDQHMAEEHNKAWGSTFAAIAQGLLEQIEAGDSTAMSTFMCNETQRCLAEVAVLRA